MKYWYLLLLGLPLMAGCDSSHEKPSVDQSSMCIATTDEQAMDCEEGELFMARIVKSDTETRAYNVLNTAALYCDTNYPIFDNSAGVICVLTHERIQTLTGLKDEADMPSENS